MVGPKFKKYNHGFKLQIYDVLYVLNVYKLILCLHCNYFQILNCIHRFLNNGNIL